jgi:hypothetical protein
MHLIKITNTLKKNTNLMITLSYLNFMGWTGRFGNHVILRTMN